MPLPTGIDKDKLFKFWDTKEGTITMGVIALVLGALGFAVYAILPTLIHFFQMGVAALGLAAISIVLAVVVGYMLLVLCNPKTWLAITYHAANTARKINRAVVEDDPIGTAKTALERMKKRLNDKIKPRLSKLRASGKTTEETINNNNAERESELQLARAALNKNNQQQAEIHAEAAKELASANEELLPVLKQTRMMEAVIARVAETAETKIATFERKIAIKERTLKAKREGQAAAAEARNLFKGSDNDMLAESMDVIADQIASAEADMESFINDVMPTLQAEDLKKGVKSEQAMADLQKWLHEQDAKPASLLESSDARQLLLEAGSSPVQATARIATPVAPSMDDLSRYFQK